MHPLQLIAFLSAFFIWQTKTDGKKTSQCDDDQVIKKEKKKRKEGLTNSSGEELAGRSVESPHTRVITEWRVGP